MRIVVVTTVWGRPRLTRIVLEHYLRMGLGVVAAVSPDEDPDYDPAMIPSGVLTVETPNDPLPDKWNRAVEMALRTDAEAFLIVGSDDLVNETYVRLFANLIQYGHDYLSPDICHFYEASSGRAVMLRHFRGGAGRMFSRRVAALGLWPEHGRHLKPDRDQDLHLAEMGVREVYVDTFENRIAHDFPVLMDVKTGVNRWGFDEFLPDRNPACSWVRAEEFLGAHFPHAAPALMQLATEENDEAGIQE